MIYLDSAATSLLKPPSVVRATAVAMRTMASPGRGGHSAAMRAADTVFTCRRSGGGAVSRSGAGARRVYHECDARAQYRDSLARIARRSGRDLGL
ncbi:MAG: hypothetical protein ACLUNO_11160 [Oscillospiraceae bacterium]